MSFLDRRFRHCVSERHYEIAPERTKRRMKPYKTNTKNENTMQPSTQLRTAINPTSRSPLRRGFLLTPLVVALASLALSPLARAQCNDGCDTTHGNTYQ